MWRCDIILTSFEFIICFPAITLVTWLPGWCRVTPSCFVIMWGLEPSWMLAKHPSPPPVMTGEVFQKEKESLALCQCCCPLRMLILPISLCLLWSVSSVPPKTRNWDAFPTRDSTAGQISHLSSSHLIMKNFPREWSKAGSDSRRDHILSWSLELFVLGAFEFWSYNPSEWRKTILF